MTGPPPIVPNPRIQGETIKGIGWPRWDKPLEIVGHCPHCGAPIYGKKQLEGEPEIRYACECRLRYGPSETK